MERRGVSYLNIVMECLRVSGNLPIYNTGRNISVPQWKGERDKIKDPPMPSPPTNSVVAYEIDQICRIVRADLSSLKDKKCPKEDLNFILSCMECADLTLLLRGLFAPLDSTLWNWTYLVKRCGHIMYHAYKSFVWEEESKSFVERGWMSMSISDYDRYLSTRSRAVGKNEKTIVDAMFEFKDAEGTINRIDVRNVVVYLIDFPLPQYLPELMIDLESKARIDLLPSGRFCMQRFVAPGVRPFMGPNIYVTPPGSSTYFHADGHGTVDSGHLALCGFNEVIMLRRLDQQDKQRALDTVREDTDYSLHVQPHDDTTYKTKPPWPKLKSVQLLRDKGFAPSHFVLQPQEFVHINKGRLHAFRKVSRMPTNAFVSKERINKNCDDIGTRQRNSNEVCISVAWDWIFQGHTARGIMEEAGVALESAVANHRGAVKRPVYSLGKTETCVIGALRAALAVEENKEEKRQEDEVSWNKSWILSEYNKENDTKCVDSKEAKQIIQGLGTVILDHIARPYDEYEIVQKEEEKQEEEEETLRQCGSLKLSMDIFEASHKAMERIVFQSESSDEIKSHISSLALKNAIKLARQARQDLKHVCEAQLNVLRAKARDQLVHPIIDIDDTVVDVAVPRLKQTIDPYGTDGFTCEACLKEMSNVYYHCMGCEILLKKDFNVCVDCARDHLHEVNTLSGTSSLKGHFGSVDWSAVQRTGQSCSHRTSSCMLCGFCVKCSCRCHTVLQKRFRFANQEQFESFTKSVRNKVSNMKNIDGDVVCSSRRSTRPATTSTTKEHEIHIEMIKKSRIFITRGEKTVKTFQDLLSRPVVATTTTTTKKRRYQGSKYIKKYPGLTKNPNTGMFHCKCGRMMESESSLTSHLGKMKMKDANAHDPIDFSNGVPSNMPKTFIHQVKRPRKSSYKPAYPDLKPDPTTGTYLCICGRDFGSNSRAIKIHMSSSRKGKHGITSVMRKI